MEKDYFRIDGTDGSISVFCTKNAYKEDELKDVCLKKGIFDTFDIGTILGVENITDDDYEMKFWKECAENID